MPLTIAERKHLMPFGAQRAVGRELGIDKSYVSAVMNDQVRPPLSEAGRKKLRRVRVALARKLGKPVDEVFPPESATMHDTPQLAQTA